VPSGSGDLMAMALLLWPAPLSARVTHGTERPAADGASPREFLLLPNARRPRILVPASSRAAAGRATGRLGADLPLVRRFARRALHHALAAGVAQPLLRQRLVVIGPRSEGIDAYLSDALGQRVLVSVQVGPLRANRKPVLHVMGADGRTLAYAKVGWNDLTRTLVRSEAATLASFGGRPSPSVRSPDVLHAGRWNDLEVLVLAPLGHARPARRRDRVPVTAMLELARAQGTATVAVTESGWWREWTAWWQGAGTGPAPAPNAGEQLIPGEQLIAGHDVALSFGRWHGDWAPWNMAVRGSEVALWDWERFAAGVPVGFDVVHFCAQVALRKHPARAAFDIAGTRAAAMLCHAGLGRTAAEAVVRLYLLEILRRYTDDARLETGGRLGRLLDGIAVAVAARLPRPADVGVLWGTRG
jgi:hypothetical protein